MIRGTTPTHTFEIPVHSDDVKDIRITYVQNEKIVVEKTFADAVFNEEKVKVDLTQEDTFAFKADVLVKIQIRVLTKEGKVLANNPLMAHVENSYNEDVLI